MKIAFIVEFPTQFEVPFYQYVDNWIKEQRAMSKEQAGFVSPDKKSGQAAQPDKGNFDSPDKKSGQAAQPDKGNFDSPDKKSGQAAQPASVEEFHFHVIYNNTDQQDYHDFELGKKVGWGFNLYEGYTFFIADKNNIVNSVSAILEKENYDYVILNGYKNSYVGLPDLCKRRNIPIALRIDSVLYNLSPLQKFLKRIYLPFAYRKFDHFFAVGSETKRFLNWLGIKNERISYFSYSVDEAWFREKANDTEKVSNLKKQLGISTQKVLLSVAKFVPRESPWDILRAFEALNDTNLILVIVGDGEEKNALEAFAKKNAHLKIIFTGYIPYQQLGYYYGISDIFIHAAKNEPWGVSVQEALSCDCVVITSDKVGSSKDLIVEGKNGFTYPFGNTEKLAEIIMASVDLKGAEKDETNKLKLNWGSYATMWNNIKSIASNQKI